MTSGSSSDITFKPDENGRTTMQSACQFPTSVLRSMFTDDSLFDVTLCGVPAADSAPARPIRAYKVVLAHASSHLRDLFTVYGYTDSHQPHYDIQNVDHESLRRIVEFIHTDKMTVDEKDAVDVVCGILAGAKYLLIKGQLADACETFLAKDEVIKADNCIKLWCFARKHSCLALMEATANFIARTLNYVAEDDAFFAMPYADCAKLLLCEPFLAANADARCRAAIAWLNHGPEENRAAYVSDVLNMVPFVSGLLMIDTVVAASEHAILQKHAPDLLREALANTLKIIQEAHPDFSVAASSVKSPRKWYVIGDSLNSDNASQFLRYDVDSRLWSTLPSLPWRRKWSAACAVGNQVIVMGGKKNKSTTADVDKFDVVSSLWSIGVAKLAAARCGLAVCSGNQTAYALGGCNSNIIESYSTGKCDRTEKLTGLLCTRQFCTASFATAHNALFMAGGTDSVKECSSIDKYDISSNKWLKVGDLTRARAGLASVFAGNDDDLYLIGGNYAPKKVEVFNVRTGQIREVQNTLNSHSGCCAVTMFQGNVVAVLGGSSPAVEAYDVREGKWTTGVIVPDMPKKCNFFSFAAV